MRIDASGCGFGLIVMFSGLIAGGLARREPDGWLRRLVVGFKATSALAFIGLCGSLATFCLGTLANGYVDSLLADADAHLGLDWVALYRFTQHHRPVQALGKFFYLSIFFSPTIVVAALAATGREQFLNRFVMTFAVSLALVLAFFPFFPAHSALFHFLGDKGGYVPVVGTTHVSILDALQAGQMRTISLGGLIGLVTFPSFHATTAILFAWAGWRVAAVRGLLLILNLGMLAATPIEGTHYFVDVIAGTLCALAAIAATSPRLARTGRGLLVRHRLQHDMPHRRIRRRHVVESVQLLDLAAERTTHDQPHDKLDPLGPRLA